MAVVLGLAVAVSYGAADFFGGLGARRSPLASVVVLSQLVGLVFIGTIAVAVGGTLTVRSVSLAMAAGAIGGVALTCLYRGLSVGRMNVVAPTTAVGAATLPVVWGSRPASSPPYPRSSVSCSHWLPSCSCRASLATRRRRLEVLAC